MSHTPDRTPERPDTPAGRHARPAARTTFTVECASTFDCGPVKIPMYGLTLNLATTPATYQFVCPSCRRVTTRYAPAATVAVIQAGTPEVVRGDIDSRVDAERMGWDVYGDEPVPAWPTDGAA